MACNLAGLHLGGLAQWTGAAAASFLPRAGGPKEEGGVGRVRGTGELQGLEEPHMDCIWEPEA